MEGKLTVYFDNQLYHFHVLPNTPSWTYLHIMCDPCASSLPVLQHEKQISYIPMAHPLQVSNYTCKHLTVHAEVAIN
jgi:hypothetical protein